MSTTAPPAQTPRRRPRPDRLTAHRPPAPRARNAQASTPAPARRDHGASTLFRVPFASAMSDADIAILTRELDLTTHMHPKLHDSPVRPGLTRIDFYSGVFFEHGPQGGHWVLEGRTWGNPPSWFVHDWHIRAAAAARQLDPTVTIPARLTAPTPLAPTAPLGRDATKPRARLASHIPGLR